jgi:hypothetical protein
MNLFAYRKNLFRLFQVPDKVVPPPIRVSGITSIGYPYYPFGLFHLPVGVIQQPMGVAGTTPKGYFTYL